MENEERYFNTPIQLYKGFMIDSIDCLSKVLYYACYEYKEKNKRTFKDAADFYNVLIGGDNSKTNLTDAEKKVKSIYESLHNNSPKVGIGLTMFWQYYKEDKTEFEKVCLLAFLALKSIIGNKSYCKVDNGFFLSRMDGKVNSVCNDAFTVNDFKPLSPEIKKYEKNNYQLRKIKDELVLNWGLKHYSHHTRGFYVSFKMPLDELVFEAEKRRKAVKVKQMNEEKKQAIAKARERLK